MIQFIAGSLGMAGLFCVALGLYLETHKPKVFRSRPRWEDIARK